MDTDFGALPVLLALLGTIAGLGWRERRIRATEEAARARAASMALNRAEDDRRQLDQDIATAKAAYPGTITDLEMRARAGWGSLPERELEDINDWLDPPDFIVTRDVDPEICLYGLQRVRAAERVFDSLFKRRRAHADAIRTKRRNNQRALRLAAVEAARERRRDEIERQKEERRKRATIHIRDLPLNE